MKKNKNKITQTNTIMNYFSPNPKQSDKNSSTSNSDIAYIPKSKANSKESSRLMNKSKRIGKLDNNDSPKDQKNIVSNSSIFKNPEDSNNLVLGETKTRKRKINTNEDVKKMKSEHGKLKKNEDDTGMNYFIYAYKMCIYEYFDKHHLRFGLLKPLKVNRSIKIEKFNDILLYSIHDLLNQNFWTRAFEIINMYTIKYYPNEDIFLNVLKIFLNAQDIILKNQSINLLKKIVSNYSVIEQFMQPVYYKLFNKSPSLGNYKSKKDNLIIYLLNLLNDEKNRRNKNIEEINDNDNSLLMASTENSFFNLDIDERIERVNIILNLLTNILEEDFVNWLYTELGNEIKCDKIPLIGQFFFPYTKNFSNTSTNIHTRLLNKLLINNNSSFDFIERLISILGEFLNFISQNTEIKYPYVEINAQRFCKDLFNMLSELSEEDFIKIIKQFRLPWIKMLLINFKLTNYYKTNSKPHITLEYALRSLRNFKECDVNINNISQKSELNKKNDKGETKLHVCCKRNRINDIKVLLNNAEIDINCQDNFKWTPLHEACNAGNLEAVKILLNYKPNDMSKCVNVNSRSFEGITPLMDAAMNNHYDICKILLEHSGSYLLRTSDNKGKTAFDHTSDKKILDLFNDFETKDKNSYEPLRNNEEYTKIKYLTELLYISFIEGYQIREFHSLQEHLNITKPSSLEMNRIHKIKLDINVNDYTVIYKIMEDMKQFIHYSKNYQLLPYCI